MAPSKSKLSPRVFGIASAVAVAVIGALGQTGVLDPGVATSAASVVAFVIAQLAHFATPPSQG